MYIKKGENYNLIVRWVKEKYIKWCEKKLLISSNMAYFKMPSAEIAYTKVLCSANSKYLNETAGNG